MKVKVMRVNTRCKIQEPLSFVLYDHWWNDYEYDKKNHEESDEEESGDNHKMEPLDRRAEETQAGYNYLAQAHCCNYHVVIQLNW